LQAVAGNVCDRPAQRRAQQRLLTARLDELRDVLTCRIEQATGGAVRASTTSSADTISAEGSPRLA
jgi:hypothetical protein